MEIPTDVTRDAPLLLLHHQSQIIALRRGVTTQLYGSHQKWHSRKLRKLVVATAAAKEAKKDESEESDDEMEWEPSPPGGDTGPR